MTQCARHLLLPQHGINEWVLDLHFVCCYNVIELVCCEIVQLSMQ